jgi:hypothetical protein
VLLLLLAGGCAKPGAELSGGAVGSGTRFDDAEYAESDLSSLEAQWSEDVSDAKQATVAIGDVRGDTAPEIVLHVPGAIRLLGRDGTRAHRIDFEKGGRRLGCLSDLDGDGKQDMVFGGVRAKSVRLSAWNGQGSSLFDVRFGEMFRGNTYPQFAVDGAIYFTAYSVLNIAPKIVGALDIAEGAPRWQYHMGPLPYAVHRAAGSEELTVSHRAVGHDRRDITPKYEHPVDRHAEVVLTTQGKERRYRSFGTATENGYRKEGQISGVDQRLVDVDQDGDSELLMLIERASELYEGRAELRILERGDGNGASAEAGGATLAARVRGPRETDGDLGFYRVDGEVRIVVVWKGAGELVLVNGAGEVLRRTQLHGARQAARLERIGDFNGDGQAEFLLSNQRRVIFLDDGLNELWSHTFSAPVRAARMIRRTDGRADLVVLAGGLHGFAPASEAAASMELYSHPAGAELLLDGNTLEPEELPLIDDLEPGRHRVTARIGETTVTREVNLVRDETLRVTLRLHDEVGASAENGDSRAIDTIAPDMQRGRGRVTEAPEKPLSDYRKLESRASRSLSGSPRINRWADLIGGTERELLVTEPGRNRFRLYDDNLELVAESSHRGDGSNARLVTDISGDGKVEIAFGTDAGLGTLYAYTGDGRLVLDEQIGYGFKTNYRPKAPLDGLLIVRAGTGYLLSPRGIYGIDPTTRTIRFFYPVAGLVQGTALYQGNIYVGVYTASNRARVRYSDGELAKDTELHLHALDTSGKRLPQAKPLSGEDIDGRLNYAALDGDGNGTSELYAFMDKGTKYYTGTPRIYRVRDSGELGLLYRGPENGTGRRYIVPSAGPASSGGAHEKERLLVYWKKLRQLELLDLEGDGEVLLHRTVSRKRNFFVANLDGDAAWELLEIHEGKLLVESVDGTRIARIGVDLEDGNVQVVDIDGNGTQEVVISGGGRVQILGY